jgi:hypothetical protein
MTPMPRPEELRALHLVADRARDQGRLLVAEAEAAGVQAAPLRSLQLDGLAEVIDVDGHPTVVITDGGRCCLLRQPSLFGT